MRVTNSIALIAGLFLLTACGGKSVWAPDDVITRSSYTHPGPTTITLMTMINNTTKGGGHSALMISGAERILFDPAGTFNHPEIPERNDVLFGFNDPVLESYVDYHARPTINVVLQTLEVSPEVAADLTARVKANGPVPNAMCATVTSAILRATPGFEDLSSSLFPHHLMRDFAEYPGVTTQTVYDYFPEDEGNVFLEAQPKQGR
jgi:hypothetical protein